MDPAYKDEFLHLFHQISTMPVSSSERSNTEDRAIKPQRTPRNVI
jgi:hypothetical protein